MAVQNNRSWVVSDSGEIVAWTEPNPHDVRRGRSPKEPKREERRLSADQLAELRRITTSPEFEWGMIRGFPCEGPRAEPDASVQIELSDDVGSRRQAIEHCLRRTPEGSAPNIVETVHRIVVAP